MDIPIPSLKKVQNYFNYSGESLCLAESCTGGLLSFWLTHLPGSSKYFKGSLVSYKTEVKTSLLGLSESTIQKEGLVTEKCALSMAQGVKKLLNANWAIAITGVAGPSLGLLEEPVGKVAFSLISQKTKKSHVQQFESLNRKDTMHQAALFALDFLISEF